MRGLVGGIGDAPRRLRWAKGLLGVVWGRKGFGGADATVAVAVSVAGGAGTGVGSIAAYGAYGSEDLMIGGKLSVADACACSLVFDPEMISVHGGLKLALYLFSCLLAIFQYHSTKFILPAEQMFHCRRG